MMHKWKNLKAIKEKEAIKKALKEGCIVAYK